MKPNYAQALNGTLTSPSGSAIPWSWTLQNNLVFPIQTSIVSDTGQLMPVISIGPNKQSFTFQDLTFPAGTFVIITSLATGSFVCVITLDPANASSTITPDLISAQNDIGPIPQPTTDIIIPPDSPSVVIGQGMAPNGNPITREQSWQRMPESYCIASGQTRTVGSSVTSGMTQTTSDSSTVSSSISSSASAGWGPISASVSASLSQSSTSMHSLTISEQKTNYESSTLQRSETETEALMVLRWQICDTITILDGSTGTPTYAPIASIVSLLQPSIVQEYPVAELPPTKQLSPMSEETKQWWLEQMGNSRAIGEKGKSPVKKRAKRPAKK